MKKLTRMFRGMRDGVSGTLSIVDGGTANRALWHGDDGAQDDVRGFMLDFDADARTAALYCNTFVFRLTNAREIPVTGDKAIVNVVRIPMAHGVSV